MNSDNNAMAGRHPPLQEGWIDAPHRYFACGDFILESGAAIRDLRLSYAIHGDWADSSLPVAVVLCAIASTHHRLDFLIGPGKALDPSCMRIIAIDAIGNGLTTSPSSSRTQPAMAFPRFTMRDMVRSQKMLLDSLGIARLAVVAGASMGGMQALQWGVMYPDAMCRIVAMTPMAKTTPWAAGVNLAARQALQAGLAGHGGGLPYPPGLWAGWSAIMQLLCPHTPEYVDQAFQDVDAMQAWLADRTRWWEGQNFDPVDWIYQSWAYDGHDVGLSAGFRGDTLRALRSVRASTLIVAPPLDLYNSVQAARWAARHIPECTYLEIDSAEGHSMATAKSSSADYLNQAVGRFVAGRAPV
jgi:homoserine O-acetyltransferase